LTAIYVDADASPVKNEVMRVAERYTLKVYLVSNHTMKMPPGGALIEMVVVDNEPDAADNWIVQHITENDVAVSGDIPLAARCIKQGARVLDPKGRIFTEESIGEALANRDIMTYLRDNGAQIGGTRPFSKQDRSRFLQRLDEIIQAVRRTNGQNCK
jgi:uncharacterized protein